MLRSKSSRLHSHAHTNQMMWLYNPRLGWTPPPKHESAAGYKQTRGQTRFDLALSGTNGNILVLVDPALSRFPVFAAFHTRLETQNPAFKAPLRAVMKGLF